MEEGGEEAIKAESHLGKKRQRDTHTEREGVSGGTQRHRSEGDRERQERSNGSGSLADSVSASAGGGSLSAEPAGRGREERRGRGRGGGGGGETGLVCWWWEVACSSRSPVSQRQGTEEPLSFLTDVPRAAQPSRPSESLPGTRRGKEHVGRRPPGVQRSPDQHGADQKDPADSRREPGQLLNQPLCSPAAATRPPYPPPPFPVPPAGADSRIRERLTFLS